MAYENSKSGSQITILHVVGSPDSQFYFKLTFYYAKSCKEYGKHVSFRYAVIHPDGLWSFPASLDDVEPDGTEPLDKALSNISQMKPDVIVHHLVCERGHSEYRGILEKLNIPILGSSAEVIAISQSKSKTRDVLQKHGVRIPEGRAVTKDDDIDLFINDIPYPCIVKPDAREDSIGITVVRKPDQLSGALQEAFKYGNIAVVERFIRGREMRVGILSDNKCNLKVLPPLVYLNIKGDEIRDLKAKLDVDENGMPIGKATASKPVTLDLEKESELVQRLSEYAKSAYRALQVRDFGLFDMRIDDDGIPWIVEENLFCCFGELSVFMSMARPAGITCDELLSQTVENALARNHSRVA